MNSRQPATGAVVEAAEAVEARSLALAAARWSRSAAVGRWSLPEAGLPDEDVE